MAYLLTLNSSSIVELRFLTKSQAGPDWFGQESILSELNTASGLSPPQSLISKARATLQLKQAPTTNKIRSKWRFSSLVRILVASRQNLCPPFILDNHWLISRMDKLLEVRRENWFPSDNKHESSRTGHLVNSLAVWQSDVPTNHQRQATVIATITVCRRETNGFRSRGADANQAVENLWNVAIVFVALFFSLKQQWRLVLFVCLFHNQQAKVAPE